MFGLIGTEHSREPGSFQRLVFTVWSRKSISIYTSSEGQLTGHVLELNNRSLVVQNITAQGIGWYTFLSLIREYCKGKEVEQRFC